MSWRNVIWMAVILCLAGLALLLVRQRTAEIAPSDPAVKDLAPAIDAYKLIRAHGYRLLHADDAWRGAVEGMTARVDPYSYYLSPGDADRLDGHLLGQIYGTGLRITETDGRLVTVGALPGSPAAIAGIPGGWEIVRVDPDPGIVAAGPPNPDGTAIDAMYLSLETARRHLRRPIGGTVTIRFRDGDGEEIVRELSPRFFATPTVTGLARDASGRWVHALDESAGLHYIRVTGFVHRRTADEFHQAYRGLSGPRGLVLDLRDNPGGLLQSAAVLVDRFVSSGVIVSTYTRDGLKYVHHGHPDGTYPPVELVVLVDERTSSAAEIAAGALQAQKRAILVGRPTFGKLVGQTSLPLADGGYLHLTTSEYRLGQAPPATQPATAPGDARIRPDVDIRMPARSAQALDALRVRAEISPAGEDADARKELLDEILLLDAQLAGAVRQLKQSLAPATQPADGEHAP